MIFLFIYLVQAINETCESVKYYNTYTVEGQYNFVYLQNLFKGQALTFTSNTTDVILEQYVESKSMANSFNNLSFIAYAQQFNPESDTQIISLLAQQGQEYLIYTGQQDDTPFVEFKELTLDQDLYGNCTNIISYQQTLLVSCFTDELIIFQIQIDGQTIQYDTSIQINSSQIQQSWMFQQQTSFQIGISLNGTFMQMEFIIQDFDITLINQQTQQANVTGYYVSPSTHEYFILYDNQLVYFNNATNYTIENLNTTNYMAISSYKNIQGFSQFQIALLDKYRLKNIQYIPMLNDQSSYEIILYKNMSFEQIPQILIDELYIYIGTINYQFILLGFDQELRSSEIIWYNKGNNNTLTIQLLPKEYLQINQNRSIYYYTNQAKLLFNSSVQSNIYAISNFDYLTCNVSLSNQMVQDIYVEALQQQMCDQKEYYLDFPVYHKINIDNCVYGPNLSYQAETHLTFKNQDLEYQEQDVHQFGYLSKTPSLNILFFQLIQSPTNEIIYFQVAQYSNLSIYVTQCNPWLCSSRWTFNSSALINQISLGAVYQQQDQLYLGISFVNNEDIFIFLLQIKLLDEDTYNLSLFNQVNTEFQIQSFLFIGQYLVVLTQNSDSQILIYDSTVMKQIQPNLEADQPKQIYSNYYAYDNTLFIVQQNNILLWIPKSGVIVQIANITIPNLFSNQSIKLGLVFDGVFVTITNGTNSSIYQIPRDFLFYDYPWNYSVQIPLFQQSFYLSMVSSYTNQFFYILLQALDDTQQIAVFKGGQYQMYKAQWINRPIIQLSVVVIPSISKFDLLAVQLEDNIQYYTNYWKIEVMLNTAQILSQTQIVTQYLNIQATNDIDQYTLQIEKNIVVDYLLNKINSIKSGQYVERHVDNFNLTLDPSQYFEGSLMFYKVSSFGQANITIVQNLINFTYIQLPQYQISAATVSNGTYIQNSKYVYQLQGNEFVPYKQFNNTQFTECPIIFIDTLSGFPISLCSNSTDTYLYVWTHKDVNEYSFLQIVGQAQPGLVAGFYDNSIMIGLFNNSQCQQIGYYFITYDVTLIFNVIAEKQTCIFLLETITPLFLNISDPQLNRTQIFGILGFSNQFGTLIFSVGEYNITQQSQQIEFSIMALEALVSGRVQLVQILQIWNKIKTDYIETKLLLQGEYQGYSVKMFYKNGRAIVEPSGQFFQQFNFQQAINSQIYNGQVITQYQTQVGSQMTYTICIFRRDTEFEIMVQFLNCKVLNTFPIYADAQSFFFVLQNGMLIMNDNVLQLSENLTLNIVAPWSTKSTLYLNASNFNSFGVLQVGLGVYPIQKPTPWGWIVFGILSVVCICVIVLYYYLKKKRIEKPPTNQYIELK